MKLNRLALAVLLAPMAAVSQAEITFTPFATYQSFDAQTVEQISGFAIAPDVEDKEGYGLSLGFRFTPAIGLEAHFARTETELEANNGDIRADRLSLDGYYTFNADGKFSPYLLLGVGEGRLKPAGDNTITDTIVNGGLGAFYRFTDKVALRMEAREVYNSDEDLNDAVAMLGLEFSPGNKSDEATTEPQQQPEPEQAPVEEVAAVAAVAAIVDADKDGVADVADKCADTPAGVQVDADGCPLDGDQDGVADISDKCPTTAESVVVDETGCDKTLTEAISMELKVNFASGAAVVRAEDKAEIERVASLLKQYPSTKVEIQGHTDSSGKKASNDKLSQARADAVKNVLVSDFGVDAARVTATGYGSSQPVADNKTKEGRAENRRVIAVVSGEATKVMTK
ncbi:MAG TPA: HAD family hydrolase [Moraxellaceae bacterium]|nr:HAD family hydrolase [Moraxellaceae bacterium]